MTTVEQALESILNSSKPLGSERVETLESFGRITAEDVFAPHNLPFFDNSAMDGYAVLTGDCQRLAALDVEGFIPAGAEAPSPLKPGTAARIMTGAPVPKNADAVVPLEETEEDENGRIRIVGGVRRGQHIRCAGEDVRKWNTVIYAGTAIKIPEVNLLAAMGLTSVLVHRKPVVAILATGDELVSLGTPLTKGKIFDSNSVALAAAVMSAGATPMMLGIAKDSVESLGEKLAEGLRADALITAAGASVGDRDLVRDVLAQLGAEEMFWGVNMKPGKAMAFAVLDGKPVFSLPGNPVSAIVTFEELVRPALLRMAGRRAIMRPLVTAVLQDEVRKKPGRVFFARLKLKLEQGRLFAWSSGPQDTGFQSPLLNADAIAVLPADRGTFSAGEEINVQIVSEKFGMLEMDTGLSAMAGALRVGVQTAPRKMAASVR